ncbi:unnamed protein product [Urochloa humidicola]
MHHGVAAVRRRSLPLRHPLPGFRVNCETIQAGRMEPDSMNPSGCSSTNAQADRNLQQQHSTCTCTAPSSAALRS